MALYKSPVAGTKKVRLGASTCVSALPSELVGILLENAAMLGPDYIVDRQEVGVWAVGGGVRGVRVIMHVCRGWLRSHDGAGVSVILASYV